jgi:hypothetical protein
VVRNVSGRHRRPGDGPPGASWEAGGPDWPPDPTAPWPQFNAAPVAYPEHPTAPLPWVPGPPPPVYQAQGPPWAGQVPAPDDPHGGGYGPVNGYYPGRPGVTDGAARRARADVDVAAEIIRAAQEEAGLILQAAEWEAAGIRHDAEWEAAAIRHDAEQDAGELRKAVMAISVDLGVVTHAGPYGGPAAHVAMPPRVPEAEDLAPLPGARAGGRQVAAMRIMAIVFVILLLVAVAGATAEVRMHGFKFFVFRPAGTGATDSKSLRENQGPGRAHLTR